MKWRLVMLLVLWWLWVPGQMAQPDVEEMLAAAKQSGMVATEFYVYAQRQVAGDAQRVYEGALRVLAGVDGARVGLRPGEEGAFLAVSISAPPTRFGAYQAMGRALSALGHQAKLTVCLVGISQGDAMDQEARALLGAFEGGALEGVVTHGYASFTGERAQAAVRANGQAYLGIPLIPLDY